MPLNNRQDTALFDLLTSVGPSGHEDEIATTFEEQAAALALYTERDAMGNVLVSLHEQARGSRPQQPVVLLDAHLDEIGFVVTHITDEGLLHFEEIGGWDSTVFVGQRVIIKRDIKVLGVVGREATHLQKTVSAPKVKDLWIDIGAKDKADAESKVSVGDSGVLYHEGGPVYLANDRIASRALDDRVGAFIILEVMRAYKQRGGALNLFAVGSVQEEVGLRGARVAAHRLEPKVAIAVDVCHCTDAGDVPAAVHGVHPLGGGPVIGNVAYHSRALVKHLVDTAKRHEIAHNIEAGGSYSGTNADSIQLAPSYPMHSGVVLVPLRHMHSPSEVAAIGDVLGAIDLLVNALLELPFDLYQH